MTTTPTALPKTMPLFLADMARSLMLGGGAVLVDRGVATGAQWADITGGVVAVISLTWSFIAAHPAKQSLIATIMGLVKAAPAAQQASWNGDIQSLLAALEPTIIATVDAAIKTRAGVLAGPVDSVANAEVKSLAQGVAQDISVPTVPTASLKII